MQKAPLDKDARMTLRAQWEARLADEGLAPIGAHPRGVRHGSVVRLTAWTVECEAVDAEYWRALTHVVHALPLEYAESDRRFLLSYCETGNILESSRQTGVSKWSCLRAIKRLGRHLLRQAQQQLTERKAIQ